MSLKNRFKNGKERIIFSFSEKINITLKVKSTQTNENQKRLLMEMSGKLVMRQSLKRHHTAVGIKKSHNNCIILHMKKLIKY